MGWLGDAVSSVGKAFSGGSGGGGLGDLIGPIATIGGAIIQGKAAKDASKEQREAAEQQIQALTQSDAAALSMLQELVRAGRPGINALGQIAGSTPEALTAEQRTAQGDLRRGARATLATAGGRGSGRAGIFSAMESERRFRESAAAENQRRKDSAAYALANIGGSAIRGQADVTGRSAFARGSALGQVGQAGALGQLAGGDQWSTVLGGGADLVAQLPNVYNTIRGLVTQSEADTDRKRRFEADQRRAAALGPGDV